MQYQKKVVVPEVGCLSLYAENHVSFICLIIPRRDGLLHPPLIVSASLVTIRVSPKHWTVKKYQPEPSSGLPSPQPSRVILGVCLGQVGWVYLLPFGTTHSSLLRPLLDQHRQYESRRSMVSRKYHSLVNHSSDSNSPQEAPLQGLVQAWTLL